MLVMAAGFLVSSALPAAAQQRRKASPHGAASTQVDGQWIDIVHGRPIKRGRSPFGPPDFVTILNDGAPVWRAGANQSTRLLTEVAMEINGTVIEPGEYTVFIELRHEYWTLIVSTWPAQERYDQNDRDALFGAFHYRPHKDVVRARMRMERLPWSFDQLSWQFLDVSDQGGRIALFWDDRMASVPFRLRQRER